MPAQTRASRGRVVNVIDMWNLTVNNTRDLDKYLAVIRSRPNPIAFDVEMISVFLKDKKVLPVLKTRALLMVTPNLQYLTIDIKFLSPRQSCSLLQGVTFPDLDHFSAPYLNHDVLTSFLQRHPRLRSLEIGECTQDICPLGAIDHSGLFKVTGPSKCIANVISTKTTHIVPLDEHLNMHMLELFDRVENIEVAVYILDTYFHFEDPDATTRIARAMPDVAYLRMKEGVSDMKGFHHGNGAWSNGLHRLRKLKSLQIRTASKLIAQPGNMRQELSLIESWVGSKKKHVLEVHLWYDVDGDSWNSLWKRTWGPRWTRVHCHSNAKDWF